MSGPANTPLFVDTGAFFAHFTADAARHDSARTTMEAIRTGELRYKPLYTTGYVLGELATLIVRKVGHDQALRAIRRVRGSDAVRVLHPGRETIDAVVDEFERFDDQQISFVDHVTAVTADEYHVDHVFAFDDDFRTLGFTLVPADVRVPES